MYNIKAAAARAGVTVPVLRAWERRYGIVDPPRTASGYRRFDDASVARIRAMRRLVDEGWSPSAAAAAILDGRVRIVDDDAPSPASDAPGRLEALTRDIDGLAARFLAASRALDGAELELVLDDLFSRGSFEKVTGDLLYPLLERLGDAWAQGDVTVAGEHLASSAVLRRLGLALDATGPGSADQPRILVGLPPGARHELGALGFAVAARRAGLSVTYLGADLPAEDWVAAAAGADAAVIGVVTSRDRRTSLQVAGRLRAAHERLVVAFGGAAAPDSQDAVRLPAPFPASIEVLKDALGATDRLTA